MSSPNISIINEFDFRFQNKVLALLLRDKEFLEQFSEIIKAPYFTDVSAQQFFEIIVSYWKNFNTVPSIEALVDEIYASPHKSKEDLINLLELAFELELDDRNYYVERISRFCQRQSAILALRDASELLKKGEIESILPSLEKSLNNVFVKPEDLGFSYWEDVMSNEKPLEVPKVPTLMGVPGSGGLDDVLKGGLEQESLGIIMMPTGRGKSVMLLNLAGNCVIQGLNAVYLSLELQEKTIARRFNIFFSGHTDEELEGLDLGQIRDTLKENYNSTRKLGKLLIKTFPTKSVTVREIESFIKLIEKRQGWKPDLLCVDYLDIVRSTSKKGEKYELLEETAEELRALAQRQHIPVWTASQVNREGSKKRIIDNDSSSNSYAKIFVADFVITANPGYDAQEQESNVTKFFVSKNRQGRDKMTLDFECDFDRMKFKHVFNSGVNPRAIFKKIMKKGGLANG